jgi:hypothetical protein
VSGVTTVSEPMAGDVSVQGVQEAPLTPGVLTATTCVVPLVIVAQAASKTASETTATGRMNTPLAKINDFLILIEMQAKVAQAVEFEHDGNACVRTKRANCEVDTRRIGAHPAHP